MERTVAVDSGACVTARRGAVWSIRLTPARIVVRVTMPMKRVMRHRVDIYNLTKYTRSNQNTCINQKPLVSPRRCYRAR